jgi:LCP family protein required for cell wall assembly
MTDKLNKKENSTSNFSTEEKSEVTQEIKKSKLRKSLSRLKRRVLKHLWLVRTALVVGILGVLYLAFLFLGIVVRKTGVGYYLKLASDFVFTPSEKIDSINSRTNILILGKGGTGHEAPDLTDTMMLVSISHTDSSITLISLPRDIWIPDLKTKLNSTYYWGNKKQSLVAGFNDSRGSGGLILTKSEVERITGQPVQYGMVIDFSGFEEIVDILGGVDVEVEHSFVDEKYPIEGKENDECGGDPEFKCRYETISFDKGVTHMDGELALKFVRSRNAEGDEGTDFARAARQQKVISAIKNKVLTREILLSKEKLRQLQEAFSKYVETDIDTEAGAILARYTYDARDNVTSYVLPEDLLVNPPISPEYDNLYVFIPKGDSWDEVHTWVKCILTKESCN